MYPVYQVCTEYLKFELKLSPYIYRYYIQQQDHFFKNQQEMANALSVLNFYHCGYLKDIYTYFLWRVQKN